MRLYLDDDCTAKVLVSLLNKVDHDVVTPASVNNAGADDAVHLLFAVRQLRLMVTRNYEDLGVLHQLVMDSGGHHPGILIIRQEQDASKNMKNVQIVKALEKLTASGFSV